LTSSIAISPTFTQPLSSTASGSGAPTVHSMSAGAIAGICIAILACLCVAALAVFLLRRRRQRKVSPDQPSGSRSVSEVTASTGTTAWTRSGAFELVLLARLWMLIILTTSRSTESQCHTFHCIPG
jgi:hypothetical protein